LLGLALVVVGSMVYYDWPHFPREREEKATVAMERPQRERAEPDFSQVLEDWESRHPLPKTQDPLARTEAKSKETPTEGLTPVDQPEGPVAHPDLMLAWLKPALDGKKAVVAIDISSPIKRKLEEKGTDMEALLGEVDALLMGLSPDSQVALLQFSRSYDWAEPRLAPLSEVRGQLREWLENDLVTTGRAGRDWQRGSPDGIQSVMQAAIKLEPDCLIVISDASFQSTTERGGGRTVPWESLAADWTDWQGGVATPVRLYGLCIGSKDADLAAFNQLAANQGGWARPWVPVANVEPSATPAASR